MHYGTIMEEYKNRYLAVKKIRISDLHVRVAVKNVITFIHGINNMEESKTSTPDGTQFENIFIPEEMKDLVEPSAIRLYPGDRRCEDLRVRDDFEIKVYSVEFQKQVGEDGKEHSTEVEVSKPCELDELRIHILDDISVIRNIQKRNGTEGLVSIASCRKEVSLLDVIPRLVKGGNVSQEGNFFIPLYFKGCQDLLTDRFFTQDADFMIKEFVRSVIQ